MKEVTESYVAANVESNVRKYWDAHNTYRKTRALRSGGRPWLFVDGPPYTTGYIHLGTAWNKILKDSILRYHSMTGKNIGGTLGAPFEGRREMQNVSFYAQDLAGEPAPNDDLDLQLIWLLAVEEQGVWKLNERMLAEYWMNYIVAPWNEYGVGKTNIANGVMPPLSGACNNERWKFSNGAWIRSEIWACLFPGSPDEALHFAWMDSCVDHCGEGIYAELFTTALESAAFVVSDLRELIAIGLSKIPADCRVARAVKLAVAEFDRGGDWRDAREAIVKDSADLGWFQAPANVAFVVLGLLYGQGGDDTDCTAATTGAILGIMLGRSGIPKNWIEPIGESIKTVAIVPF